MCIRDSPVAVAPLLSVTLASAILGSPLGSTSESEKVAPSKTAAYSSVVGSVGSVYRSLRRLDPAASGGASFQGRRVSSPRRGKYTAQMLSVTKHPIVMFAHPVKFTRSVSGLK